jgi:hypothetical protein
VSAPRAVRTALRAHVAWVAAATLALGAAGCRDVAANTVVLRLAVERTTMSIRVENRTAHEVVVPANFLDRAMQPALGLRISTERGVLVPMCRDIAYVDGADPQRIAPGTAGTIEVDAATVMQTHCLEAGRPYRIEAVYVDAQGAATTGAVVSNVIVMTLAEPAAP